MKNPSRNGKGVPEKPDCVVATRSGPEEETGRYIITAHLCLECYPAWQRVPRRFPSVFIRDEYQGWKDFHCTFDRGAMLLRIQPEGSGWICQDNRWQIDSVLRITREEYLLAIQSLRSQ